LTPELRDSLFPVVDPAWILEDDGALLFVDKPAGISAHAAREGELGLVERIASRGGYVGVHQRLDKETSGICVFTRAEEHNAEIAKQIEGREVAKTYVAGVVGWRGEAGTLRHRLRTRRGRAEVHPKGKPAVTHVKVLRRVEDRALLRLRLETGRTHQLRAQLAEVGAPIAGDTIYGGGAAPRLLLHSERLGLVHPMSGARVEREAPRPACFERWLEDADAFTAEAVRARLRDALRRRDRLGRSEGTTAFRLLQGDAEGVPGLIVDFYDGWVVAHVYDAARPHEDMLLDALEGLGVRGVYVKRRQKQANVIADTRAPALAPPEPVRGESAPEPLEVVESGLAFEVSLGDGFATGLYVDQRDARERIRGRAAGRSMLNLFAYTGAFSVAAAAGGARTLTLDVSRMALARARTRLDRFEGDHRVIREDCFGWLERAARREERFDLIVCDPPTYAKTKKRRWSSGKMWIDLAAACLRIAAPDGELLLCSNDARMSWKRFRRYLRQASERAGRPLKSMRDLPVPEDVPAPPGEEHPLKRVWVET